MNRRAIVLTAPSPTDGVRIPRSWARTGSGAVRIWAPPPPPDPPRRRKARAPAPPARADAAAPAAPSGPPPPPPVAHTVRLATQADLVAMATIERACGNPAWGPNELQHELDSPTATVAVVEAWDLRRASSSDDPDAGRDEPAPASTSAPQAPPALPTQQPSLPAVVGLAIWWTVADEVQLLELAVHPAARRRGAGQALAAVIAGLPPPGGCALLEVAAGNVAARATYAAAGFREVGVRRAYYKDGSDAVLMRADVQNGGEVQGQGGRGELPVV